MPSKLTAIGTLVGAISIFLALIFQLLQSIFFNKNDVALEEMAKIRKVLDRSIILGVDSRDMAYVYGLIDAVSNIAEAHGVRINFVSGPGEAWMETMSQHKFGGNILVTSSSKFQEPVSFDDPGYFLHEIDVEIIGRNITGRLPLKIYVSIGGIKGNIQVSMEPRLNDVFFGALLLEMNLAGLQITGSEKRTFEDNSVAIELTVTELSTSISGKGLVFLTDQETVFEMR